MAAHLVRKYLANEHAPGHRDYVESLLGQLGLSVDEASS